MERKLLAILSADVKGYSRLMGEDDEATIRTLTTYREEMTVIIRQHRGRVVDSPGDNLLAEFASAVDAVQGAVIIQSTLKAENSSLPPNRQMEYRIGINLGDVVVEEERIYGDGVNIAARLESLAEPGGLCISGKVYDEVKSKLVLGYEYQGEQTVKNIAELVRVYKVELDSAAAVTPAVRQEQAAPSLAIEPQAPRRWSLATIAIVMGLVVAAGTVVLGNLSWRSSSPSAAVVPFEKGSTLLLPDKPSIAVLPFTNMSGDPEQEYFSDGLTEDLLTDLSKLSALFVIARNSSFAYKGKVVKVAQVGRELGVRYVVAGSVRKADSRLRITARLMDASMGHHIWAERYDRPLRDIFAMQDEVAQKIVESLKLKLTAEEQERLMRRHTDSLEAYDHFLRGKEQFHHFTKESTVRGRQMLENALERDPKFAGAHAWLSWTHWQDWAFQWSQDPQTLERAFERAQKAIEHDPALSLAHSVLGSVYLWKDRQYEQAIATIEKAITLNPNDAENHLWLGHILNFAGRPTEAIEEVKTAMRLNPKYPFYYLFYLAHAYYLAGQYDEAIKASEKALTRARADKTDPMIAHLHLATSYTELGREEEARAEAAEMLRISPNLSLEVWRQRLPYKDPAVLERLLAALSKAGLK